MILKVLCTPFLLLVVSTDNRSYTLMLLCWTPYKESPIHDHPCDGCWLRLFLKREKEKDKRVGIIDD